MNIFEFWPMCLTFSHNFKNIMQFFVLTRFIELLVCFRINEGEQILNMALQIR